MKTVAIIQARMGSTRLPGKVLMDLSGRPMLAQQLARLKRCTRLDELVVATTTHGRDDPVEAFARADGVRCFRGSEDDVLSRYVGAAAEARADAVVRITADCPLIDPEVTDQVVRDLVDHSSACDYATNTMERTYPAGLDVEVFFIDVLHRIDRLSKRPEEREHVTGVVWTQPTLFLCRHVKDDVDNSDLRWVVDRRPDLHVVRAIYDGLGLDRTSRPYREVLAFARAHPELGAINVESETSTPR